MKLNPKNVFSAPKPIVNKLTHRRNNAFNRFPLVFTLLGAFGVVSTFYGFERLIDKLDFFADRPVILLATGVLTLALTGALYKKL